MKIKKRNGIEVPFNSANITNAVKKALKAVGGGTSASVAETITADVMDSLKEVSGDYTVEKVQDLVEIALMRRGLLEAAKAYILHRSDRARARRKIQVRTAAAKGGDLTDRSLLLVKSMTRDTVTPWDRSRITQQLMSGLGMTEADADGIAKRVEDKLILGDLTSVGTSLIREIVNNELATAGYSGQLKDTRMQIIPDDFLNDLMYDKSVENSNIVSNNPEAVNLAIAELVLKQWALTHVFSDDIRKAHETGAVHLHDLGYPTRVYCSSHSLEYIKKYGLSGLLNINTISTPAKHASVLTGHLNTYLASMQANYAGALGIAYINILYAPYLEGFTDYQYLQTAQELVFNGSQNAFSRGGQTLFLDFNIHTGVPSYLKNIPVIGPGGKYKFRRTTGETADLEECTEDGRWLLKLDGVTVLEEENGVQHFLPTEAGHVITYKDYEAETRRFAMALLDVWEAGDAMGHVFEFPKCDFHVSTETFTDPEQYKVFQRACEVAANNGSTYFVFDRDDVTLSACCRLRTTITDKTMLTHPEHMRFAGVQNVTVNVPQCAYRAHRDLKDCDRDTLIQGFLDNIGQTMDLAVKAHLQKKAALEKLMDRPGTPLWQVGKVACDGRKYVDLETSTYIIGIIGVNDAVQYLTGQQMHESDEAMDLALKVASYMYVRAKEYTAKYNLKFNLEESPAESAARRLAKADLMYFRDDALKVYKGGDEEFAYYTNSIHITADAPISMVERIRQQSKFHSVIESGAIIHAFIGEETPDPRVIAEVIRRSLLETQAAQITFSPEFTYCSDCGYVGRGLQETCPQCGSSNVVGETRVVGYFSKIQNWNKSKRYGELVARHSGDYSVMSADSAMEGADNE